jgi:predicted glycogen debranching enzyme
VRTHDGRVSFALAPGQVRCLATATTPRGMNGLDYRRQRAQAASALSALSRMIPLEDLGPHHWRDLATVFAADPARFLGTMHRLDRATSRRDLIAALAACDSTSDLPKVVVWTLADLNRIVPVPPGHWILVRDASPFSASLGGHQKTQHHVRSVPVGKAFVAWFPPAQPRTSIDVTLTMERFVAEGRQASGCLRLLGQHPEPLSKAPADGLALLTNGRGAMARLHADLGRITSKYDCLLAANLHAAVPCDRHVLVKRLRAWVNADGFITVLDRHNLASFEPGPPARWHFVANAGDGRIVPIDLTIDLLHERNTAVVRFSRPDGPPPMGVELPADLQVRLTVRLDVEDRSFHAVTVRHEDLDRHFPVCVHALDKHQGFRFAPAADRILTVASDAGIWHGEAEWSIAIPHPVDAERGQAGSGDAWSPGWFELPLAAGAATTVTINADTCQPTHAEIDDFIAARETLNHAIIKRAVAGDDVFANMLAKSAHAFVVRRDQLKTVIAGYPWFLDWGRDSLICARGLIAAGLHSEVQDLLVAFARLERDGTLPNCLNGDHDVNRDTSDAPLWFGVACEELAAVRGKALYQVRVDATRCLADVLTSIATGYLRGTPNGIMVDPASGLVFSPAHFTWMDTNYPACSPREGYPVEIQTLWIRLLRQLEHIKATPAQEPWWAIADRAQATLRNRYWIEEQGWLADNLIAPAGLPAEQAVRDESLRSNGLFAVCSHLLDRPQAQRLVQATITHLVVPGALRSLAPLTIKPALIVLGANGQPLFDPIRPYQGHYVGDEDSRRKPAYHNGTAWTWTFPTFCEALALAWNHAPDAVAAAKAYLASADRLLGTGCLGHLPEIIDGDAPHAQRGCDAQAWSACESLRVWKLLHAPHRHGRR